MRYSLPMGNMV
jgi:Guanylate kinase